MPSIVPLHPFLCEQLRTAQLPHAFIFTGNAKEKQAIALAAALECQQPKEDYSSCGVCVSCRHMLAGTHPDVFYLVPNGNTHKAEAMRELVSNASQSRFCGRYQIFILTQAESMSVEAANTLLKLLEEPVPGTVLILLTDMPDQLLGTILSRCQLYQFSEENGANDVECPPEIFRDAETFLSQLPSLPLYAVLLKGREYDGDRESFRYFLYALLQLFHAAAIGERALSLSFQAVLDSADLIEKALALLERETNQKMLADVVLLKLRQNCV